MAFYRPITMVFKKPQAFITPLYGKSFLFFSQQHNNVRKTMKFPVTQISQPSSMKGKPEYHQETDSKDSTLNRFQVTNALPVYTFWALGYG